MKLLETIRALLIAPLILIWTGVMALVSLLLSLFDPSGVRQHECARVWARFILWISGTEVQVRHPDLLSSAGPFILVSNHQSFFDIFSLLAFLPVQFRFFAKDSLFRVPFLGWHLKRAGHLPIDRSNARATYASFRTAVERVKTGTSVVIFPEGSRSATGDVRLFKTGSLRLALTSSVPVIPISIYGSRDVLPKGSFLITRGRIDILVGEPIVPLVEDLKDKERFVEMVRSRIVDQYQRLQAARQESDAVVRILAANGRE